MLLFGKSPLRLLLPVVLLFAFSARAQRSDSVTRFHSIVLGVSAGNYVFADIGYGANFQRHNSIEPVSGTWAASSEVRWTDRLLIGPKIGVWVGNAAAVGANLIYYTDLRNGGTLVFRPEAGFGIGLFKVVYGYNFGLTNTKFGGINRSLVQLDVCIPTTKPRMVKGRRA